MTGLLSIVRRELAVGARQTSTHRVRLFAGGAVIALFALFLFFQSGPPNFVGPMLFGLSSFFLFLQALLSGVRYTADALSEEKREGTLGLLFLTELRSGEVVLGKMIVRSLRGFYALIATLPVFTFCILLGGVTGLNAFYMALLLLTTMIFSLSACIYISSCVTEDKSAFIGSLGILAAFAFIPPTLWKICFTIAPLLVSWDFLLYPSPIYAYHALPGSAAHVTEFLYSIACLYLLSGAFLFLATRNLTRSFKHDFTIAKSVTNPYSIASPKPFERDDWTQTQTQRANATLNQNPFLWLLARERLYPKLMRNFAIGIVIAAIIAWMSVSARAPGLWVGIFVYGLGSLHWVWKLLVASHALRRLHDEHRSGALEILLVTPLEIDQILSAQLNHTFRVCSGAALAICAADAIMLTRVFSDLLSFGIGGAIFLFLDARAITWLAMLQALNRSRFPAAVLRVIGLTLLPPFLILMLILYSGRAIVSTDTNALFFFWFAACGLYDLVLIHRAKHELRSNFRTLASEGAKQNTSISTLPKPLQWLLLREPVPAKTLMS